MDKTLQVLILEDNPADAELIKFELEEAGIIFASKVVMTEEDFIHELHVFSPDVILSDYDLPRYTGALALVEAKRCCPDVPFILVTGAISEDRAIEILTSGAKDYVMKSRLNRLSSALQRAVAEAEEHRARKKAEEENRVASLYSRSLIEASLDPLVTISPDGKVMDVNKATEEVTGVSRDQIIGTDFADYFTEPEKAQAGYEEAFLNGSVRDYPLALRHISGLITEVLYNATTFADETGEVKGVFAAARDVTELKKAEKDLREAHRDLEDQVKKRTVALEAEIEERKKVEESLRGSERRERERAAELEALLDAAPTPIFIAHDPDCLRLTGNRAANDLLRIPRGSESSLSAPAEVRPRHFKAVRNGRELGDEELPAQRAARGTHVRDFEFSLVFNDGTIRHVLGYGTPLNDEKGHSRGAVHVLVDITEHKRAEDAVMRAKQEWERTFDAVPDLIAILDNNHHILRANRAMAERLGLTPAQCVGKTCYKVVHGTDSPPALCPHVLTLADDAEHMAEVHESCLGGYFLVSTTPITDELGRSIGSVHVARDINKRKEAEEAFKERTCQLEEANKELESFSYSVSHDLRAPLRAIDGYSRMILRKRGDQFDDETKRQFDQIRDSVKAMGRLIDDLLAFSRLGRQDLNKKSVNIHQLIEETWLELQSVNPDRRMSLKMNDTPPGWGDRALLKQVFVNILSNAVKFTRTRDVALIEAGGDKKETEIIYYMKDNGVGFEMQYHDKLFGVFQRLHSADEYEGTGIGLALVQRIIHRHGGRIWAEGKMDEGATFYFALPKTG
jgi:PAS domain S-box-containing protein